MKTDKFCPIPWIFQGVRSNGDIRICCQANISPGKGLLTDQNGRVLNAAIDDLETARNADLMKEVRLSMLADKWHTACHRCEQEERFGLNSRRNYELKQWEFSLENAISSTNHDGEISGKEIPVKYYDLRFGNLCNLACRMCGPTDSSSWYSDWVEINDQTEFIDGFKQVKLTREGNRWVTKEYNWHESSYFWDQLELRLNDIRHLYMVGGEPLLIERHYDFLEVCIKADVAKNITLEYNTNLTILGERVINLWKAFKQVKIGASIDGINEVFEYQRYPAKWDRISENLKFLAEQPSNIVSWIACTVTAYNVFHFPDFIDWKLSRPDLKNINNSKKHPVLTYHLAHHPKQLNIRVLPVDLKSALELKFKNYLIKIRSSNLEDSVKTNIEKMLNSILTYMQEESYFESHWREFVEHTTKLDKRRGQSLLETVKEFQASVTAQDFLV